MEVDSGDTNGSTEEEVDVLRRSKWRGNDDEGIDSQETVAAQRKFASYKDLVTYDAGKMKSGFNELFTEGEGSDDDVIEESDDETWFSIGMTRKEKIEVQRPWRNSLIVKLIG